MNNTKEKNQRLGLFKIKSMKNAEISNQFDKNVNAYVQVIENDMSKATDQLKDHSASTPDGILAIFL